MVADIEGIEARVEKLEGDPTASYAEIFRKVCQEFDLDGEKIKADLGCECPYALIGYLEQEENA